LLDYEFASRLRLTWHPGRDGDDEPTEVEVTFTADNNGTLVVLEHRGWENLSGERREGRHRLRERLARSAGAVPPGRRELTEEVSLLWNDEVAGASVARDPRDPRTIAAGMPSTLPITSSAALAISSATAIIVACST